MANFTYNVAKAAFFKGDIDFDADDIRVVPVMENTTCDTENDGIATFADFATDDEFDGSGYSSGGIALASEAATQDDTDDEGVFDAADVSGLSYSDGSRDIVGVVLIKFQSTLGGSLPIAFIDTGGFPVAGSNFTGIAWNAEGILNLN